MPLITASHDSLPYIDRPSTPTSTSTAHALIRSSRSPDASSKNTHPLLPEPPDISHSPLIQSELSRIASKTPLTGIDLSRYEATPSLDADTDPAQARETLEAAYTNASYLTLRLQALELLEKFGKNAWLIGNSQLEDILRDMEKELVETRGRVEGVNRERKGAQEGPGERWKLRRGRGRREWGIWLRLGLRCRGLRGEYREELRRRG
ncbi:hypothetical protein ABVK25_007877 [Lepraria finkii]|uniref:Uncharacterized protein n=1 Tax=Lepraria finkii TaxID=1340010 RepID=A0ABR4B3U1_9LECA